MIEGRITARFAAQDGSAMVIAVAVLLIIGMLSAATLSAAVQTNGSTVRDSHKKAALEAAEAGLQVATYRLNMLAPDNSHCVGDAVASPVNGFCQSSNYTLGNGATYSYNMTPVMAASDPCVGMTLTGGTGISQRCITAVGTASGVIARSQVRVAAFAAVPLFPVAGITGIKSLSNSNNDYVNAWEASNGTISLSNNASINGYELGPGGNLTAGNNASAGTKVQLSSPIVLDPVNPGTSNQTSLANCPGRTVSCNDDYRITNGAGLSTCPTNVVCDPNSGVTFTAATRTLSMSNNASITLGGGLYNFCSFTAVNNATITLAPGVKAEIIIDSPDDPGSGCPAGSGSLSAKNNVTWSNPSKDPTALQIYVYGWNNGLNVVDFKNNSTFYGVMYAPQSTINMWNNAAFWGAISGAHVAINNNFTFDWDSRAGSLQASSTGVYYRTAWAQCVPTPPSTAGSGCG